MGVRAQAAAAVRKLRAGPAGMARFTRKATHAHGAGNSGLGSLIEVHALNSAGDALVAVALAGTIFFGLDVNKARTQVALYLLLTMAPFALIAPLIGPALDRIRSARRIAIAGTFLARGLLCWSMAGAVQHGDQVTFLPAAFGCLVLSKAFGILRSAVTPRVLPEQITLVTANARASFAGLLTAAIVTPVAAGFGFLAGPDWVLRLGTAVFFGSAFLGLRLPGKVETPESEHPAPDPPGVRAPADEPGRWRTLLRVGPTVTEALGANATLRAFSGFLILYLAFMLRGKRFDPIPPNVALGLLAAAAGIGGLVGTAVGAWVKSRAPQLIIFATLALSTASAAAAAVFFDLWTALAVAFVGALGQSLGKLSLDAVVQREIGDEIRSSTFAVSETLHQLVWVVGGLAGLAMSTVANGHVALGVLAVALGLATIALASHRRRGHRAAPPPVRSWPVDPAPAEHRHA
jgi:MFS family permease